MTMVKLYDTDGEVVEATTENAFDLVRHNGYKEVGDAPAAAVAEESAPVEEPKADTPKEEPSKDVVSKEVKSRGRPAKAQPAK